MVDLLHTEGLNLPSTELMEHANRRARELAQQSKADNTLKAYRKDWQQFTEWCGVAGAVSLPATPEIVAAYLGALMDSGRKASTIQRAMSSISQAHQLAGAESPTLHPHVRMVMQGIRRVAGTAQTGKAPALTEDITAMLDMLPDTLIGARDRALLLVGFAGAFRRSELVSLDVADVETKREGLVVTIRRSKTDQEGQGRAVAIPHGVHSETDPVEVLHRWLAEADIHEGPVFRAVNRHGQIQRDALTPYSVALIVKRAAEAAGLDPDRYAGHSLRAGHATTAAGKGADERAIMAQLGHSTPGMTRRYIREANLFRNNSAGSLGL